MREKEIEKILADEVKKLGGRAYKWVSPGNDGVPDRIVILPGRIPIFVEMKADGGVLSKLQEIQTNRLKNLGQDVRIVTGIKGVILFFDQIGYQDVSCRLAEKYAVEV